MNESGAVHDEANSWSLSSEDQLFEKWRDRLAERTPALFRDGIPDPDAYWEQERRILFLLPEPNIPMQHEEHDLGEELAGSDALQKPPSGWWLSKMSVFAHAVSSALKEVRWDQAWEEYKRLAKTKKEILHSMLLKFGYIQLKKTGGGGSSSASIVRWYVKKDHDLLLRQITTYKPHALLGCGVSGCRPARLTKKYVFPQAYGAAEEFSAEGTTLSYWRSLDSSVPTFLMEFYHPSSRKKKKRLHKLLHGMVAHVTS